MVPNSKIPLKATPSKIRLTGKSRLTGVTVTIVALAGFFAMMLFLFIGTSVEGVEFSPSTFQLRAFQYRRIPGIKFRLTKTIYATPSSVVGTAVLKHLPGTAVSNRWDIVRVSEGASGNERRASFLVQSLQTPGPNRSKFWEEWSHHNPTLAKELWPIVQKAAIDDQYFSIPEMLQIARSASSTEELTDKCQQILDNSPGVASE